MRVLGFDTETTGLIRGFIDPSNLDRLPYIVQFSYIVYDDEKNEFIKLHDSIIKLADDIEIPEESIKFHGVTREMSNGGVQIKDVLNEFMYHMRGVDKVIGHNIEFDLNMVRVELMRIIVNPETYPAQISMFKGNLHFINNVRSMYYCTMKETTDFCNIRVPTKNGHLRKKWPTLAELHNKLFNKTPDKLHNSLNDVLVTLRCYMKYNHDIDLNNKFNHHFKHLNIA